MPSPPPGPERIAWTEDAPELLRGALEHAVALARRDATSREAPPPPAALRPVLRFTRLPGAAMRTVTQVLDRDDEFRARVAGAVTEDDVGRASWIFLTRPEGWSEELDLLAAAAHEELADETAARREQSAARRLEQLDAAATQLRAERDGLRRELESERSARSALASERDRLVEQVDELQTARDRAVRELKQVESAAAARLEELRALREERRSDVDGELRSDPAEEDEHLREARRAQLARLAASVTRAADAAALLDVALAEAVELLPSVGAAGVSHRSPEPGPTGRAGDPGTRRDRDRPVDRPPRRSPVRLRSGVHEDSADGIRQLLGLPTLVAVIDGYNVTMEGWPTLDRGAQRDSLVAATGSLQAQVPASIHVVFDGDADGSRPAVGAPLPVRVHFSSADAEADDVILDMVARLPTDVPVLVVSSDRRVAEGARRLGANAVASSVLLDLLRR
jgi:predicted RNA-binding protein with PIN domain